MKAYRLGTSIGYAAGSLALIGIEMLGLDTRGEKCTILSPEQREAVKAQIKASGIRKECELLEQYPAGSSIKFPVRAIGSSLLPGKVAVLFQSRVPEESLEFVVAHELAHIRSNDLVTMPMVGAISGSLMSNCLLRRVGPNRATLIGAATYIGSIVAFGRWREKRADRIGFLTCSKKGQEGAIMYFEKKLDEHLSLRNDPRCSPMEKMRRRILIDEKGEYRLDVSHPPLRKRIEYLKSLKV